MTLVVAARNTAMDAVTIDAMSLHSGFPGETGANELTGSGYARQTTSFNASSGGVRTLATAETFTVGAGHTEAQLRHALDALAGTLGRAR